MLSITTDYVTDTGSPEPYLQAIAEAGFSHVHWCHQWNTDFLYDPAEISQIARWLDDFGLRVLDIHASHGKEKAWGSRVAYERLAGVSLVRNRIEMAAALGSGVIILHIPRVPPEGSILGPVEVVLDPIRRSLDALAPIAQACGVRIALENMGRDDFGGIRWLFNQYGPEFLGLCYDAGHGNIDGTGLDHLATLSDRLISVHLHDNDGTGDQHTLLFRGTVDWPRLAGILAQSAYADGIISMELSIDNAGIKDEAAFLQEGFRTGTEFAEMVQKAKGGA